MDGRYATELGQGVYSRWPVVAAQLPPTGHWYCCNGGEGTVKLWLSLSESLCNPCKQSFKTCRRTESSILFSDELLRKYAKVSIHNSNGCLLICHTFHMQHVVQKQVEASMEPDTYWHPVWRCYIHMWTLTLWFYGRCCLTQQTRCRMGPWSHLCLAARAKMPRAKRAKARRRIRAKTPR